MHKHIAIDLPKGGRLTVGNNLPLVFMIGPNTLESRAHALEMSGALAEMAAKLKIGMIYKTSFDKANRSSVKSARGIGLEAAMPILAEIRQKTGLPIITDVHEKEQCKPVAEVADILQIPAFLCRQTDLLLAAGATGRPINVKKGQFLAPWEMPNIVAKIASTGNDNVMLCERGVSFGYNTLVNDMRALPQMAETGYPVVFDATHSVQQPGGQGRPRRRPARIRAGACTRSRGGWAGRHFHRNAPRPGSRTLRRAEYGAVEAACRLWLRSWWRLIGWRRTLNKGVCMKIKKVGVRQRKYRPDLLLAMFRKAAAAK